MSRFLVPALFLAGLVLPAHAQTAPPATLIAQGCAGCHGQNGAGQGGTPRIAEISRQDFLRMWAEFRADQRPASVMNRIARGYTDAEASALADYFSRLR